MFKVRLLAPAFLAALALSACGGQGQPENATPSAEPTQITILNHSFFTVDIFIIYNDQTFRVDQVFGASTKTVRMPRFVAPTGSIRVLVDPVGRSQAYLSDPVAYVGNEDFRLSIEESLDLSSFIPVERRR